MAVFRTRFLKGGIAVVCFVCLTYVFLLNDAPIIRDADEIMNILPSKDFVWKTSIEQTGLHVQKISTNFFLMFITSLNTYVFFCVTNKQLLGVVTWTVTNSKSQSQIMHPAMIFQSCTY